jgi:excisionase family DNA binding protein
MQTTSPHAATKCPLTPRRDAVGATLPTWLRRALAWWLGLTLLAASLLAWGQEPAALESALLEMARQHLRTSTPKGLALLHEPTVTLVTKEDRRRVVEFAVEFECAEPRYVVRQLTVDERPLPAAVAEQLKAAGVATRYLAPKWRRAEPTGLISGSFSVLADGTFGVILGFDAEQLGYLRAEQTELPVQGDTVWGAAQKAATAAVAAHAQASRAAFMNKAADVGGGLFNVVKGNLNLFTGGLPIPGLNPTANPAAPATNVPVAAASAPAVATNAPVPVPVPAAEPPKDPAVAPVAVEKAPANPAKSAKGPAEWLTPKEVAELLKISEEEVFVAIGKGEIKAKKIGSVWRISPKDLE